MLVEAVSESRNCDQVELVVSDRGALHVDRPLGLLRPFLLTDELVSGSSRSIAAIQDNIPWKMFKIHAYTYTPF